MKNLFLLLVCLFHPMPIMANENMLYKFSGVWVLNDKNTHFGGEMKIYDCNDTECYFELQSWYDLHICDVSGKLIINNANAIYVSKYPRYDKEQNRDYFISVGIMFESAQDGSLNLKYLNSDSHGAFCGMSATVEGLWIKQDNQ